MKKLILSVLSMVLIVGIFCSILIPLQTIYGLEGGFLADYEDVNDANQNNTFGSFIKTELKEKEKSVGGQKEKHGEVIFKLFGFLPIRKVNVVMTNDEEYYVGGIPIGLEIFTDGAIVVSKENENSAFREGDIITHINGERVENLEEIDKLLNRSLEEVEVQYIRKNKPLKTLIKATKDETGKIKLGLWVKDDVTGVGTLTFVNKKTREYGALGHPIVEADGGNIVPVSNGEVFECNLVGINKGKKNNPGELRCVLHCSSGSKGNIKTNSKFGISGVLNDVKGLVDENLTAKLGGRLGVRMGNAKLVSSISGIREEYDIEIIKANYQKSANDKSLIFRVKDKRLLELTGGIVQGMSGSPIMQDGKLIGAVTHVFLTDPTKGYGVYSDWMLA